MKVRSLNTKKILLPILLYRYAFLYIDISCYSLNSDSKIMKNLYLCMIFVIFVDSLKGYGKRTENIQAGQHFPD